MVSFLQDDFYLRGVKSQASPWCYTWKVNYDYVSSVNGQTSKKSMAHRGKIAQSAMLFVEVLLFTDNATAKRAWFVKTLIGMHYIVQERTLG